MTVNVPKSAVEGSARVYLTGTADLLGPAMNNLVNLIRYGLKRNIFLSFFLEKYRPLLCGIHFEGFLRGSGQGTFL